MHMSHNVEFEWVEPRESDLQLIMQWRHDPISREMSYHREPLPWEKFTRRFMKTFYTLPELPPLFALLHKTRVAFVGFEPIAHPLRTKEKACLLSLIVAPSERGKGVATAVLKAAVSLVSRQGFSALVAEIKPKNIPSKKAFMAAGFTFETLFNKEIEDLGITETVERYVLFPSLRGEKQTPSVFVIAEAGSNWHVGNEEENFSTAKKLIDVAVEAQADAVKFQLFRPETLYVRNAGKSDYLAKANRKSEIFSLIEDLAMPQDKVPELAAYCQSVGIEFMVTPFSPEAFKWVDPFVKRHKIASYEISHPHLLSLAAKSQKPLLLSTGAATEEEVGWAVGWFRAEGGKELTLLQCTAQYPADTRSMNLQAIPYLKSRFGTDAGLSDHSEHPLYAPLMAMALGATVIEKHFTLGRQLPGPDHPFAIEPQELKEMVKALREGVKMLGSGLKEVQSGEEELRSFARRGLQAIKEIHAGEPLHEGENMAILRPGKQLLGMHPRFLPFMEGRTAQHTIPPGKGIHWEDVNL